MMMKFIALLFFLSLVFVGNFSYAQVSNNNNIGITTKEQAIKEFGLACMTTPITEVIHGVIGLLSRFIIIPLIFISIILIVKNKNNKNKQKNNKILFYILLAILFVMFIFMYITANMANQEFKSSGCGNKVDWLF